MNKESKRIALTTKTLCIKNKWDVMCGFCNHVDGYCNRYKEDLTFTDILADKANLVRLPQCLTDFPGVIVMTAMKG